MDFSGKEKTEFVKDTFNTIAVRYDLMNSLMSLGMDGYWRRKVVQIVRARDGMRILDVCCGTGKLTGELAKAIGPTGEVIGVDFSEKMLDQAWKNLSSAPEKDNIKLLQGDAMSLGFANDSFDGVTVGWGLRNLPDLRQGLQEMVRVARKGSMIVSIDMGQPVWPVFKQLYWFTFKTMIPFLGRVMGGMRQEYQYLYSSASEFESPDSLAGIFADCGLIETGYLNLFGGIVAIVYGQKP